MDDGAIDERVAGVLAHVTSLPGAADDGGLGPTAERFLDWVRLAGLRAWQLLPVGPTHGDGSPYSALSSFAGSARLISIERLVQRGWLSEDERPAGDGADAGRRAAALAAAADRFERDATEADRRRRADFETGPAAAWLPDWTLFATARRAHDDRAWTAWDPDLRRRRPDALAALARRAADDLRRERFLQFAFRDQWDELRTAADARGVALIGDVPFYPAHDSADVWAAQHLFELDASGRPTRVAGVPPDYFSEDGQLWGNPIYRWERRDAELIDWWERRLAAALGWTPTVRLDHFRAFAGYWVVDADARTARDGHWETGPGLPFFEELRRRLGGLPFLAEDLGDITPDVDALREALGLAGMKILQFGFGGDEASRRHTDPDPNSVTYTGTHDNDTLRGWFAAADPETRHRVQVACSSPPERVPWALVERALASASRLAVVPLQDLLELGGEARMNHPGRPEGNWTWRAAPDSLTLRRAERVRALVEATRPPAATRPRSAPAGSSGSPDRSGTPPRTPGS